MSGTALRFARSGVMLCYAATQGPLAHYALIAIQSPLLCYATLLCGVRCCTVLRCYAMSGTESCYAGTRSAHVEALSSEPRPRRPRSGAYAPTVSCYDNHYFRRYHPSILDASSYFIMLRCSYHARIGAYVKSEPVKHHGTDLSYAPAVSRYPLGTDAAYAPTRAPPCLLYTSDAADDM
eukprot:2222304-Rhodomonas_salina.1